MRKIYLYSLIVTLLALTVFTAGCTQNNQTNQSNTTGSYAVNGLSFNYPIEWVITSQTRGNVNSINIFDQDFLESNGTKGDLVLIVSQPKTENITYDSVKKSMTNSSNITYNTTNNTVNIAGLTGNMTTFTGKDSSGNETQLKLIYFEKNNFVYILNFIAAGGVNIQDQQKYFDIIINSFQVP
jgi:hypothetical protein